MKKENVPQDDNETLRDYSTKVIYAVDETGKYTAVKSSGWDVEEVVLQDVVADFEQKAADAKQRVFENKTSPVEYFMHKKLMDLPALSFGIGIPKRKIKRHMTPDGFAEMDQTTLETYADFFDIDIRLLTRFKENI